MRIISFNINGLRAHFHQLERIFETLKPDIIGLQETKIHDSIFPEKEILKYGYNSYYHGQKKHYGVALCTKKKILSIQNNISTTYCINQHRMMTVTIKTKHGILTIINGYFPHGDNRNHPIKFKDKKAFYKNLKNHINTNYNNSLLILMGDMNISHNDIDIGIGKTNKNLWIKQGKCAFLQEEIEWLNDLLNVGLIDSYRYTNSTDTKQYTWFDYRSKQFEKNKGLRIDMILMSVSLKPFLESTGIEYAIRNMKKPSDHVPIWAEFNL